MKPYKDPLVTLVGAGPGDPDLITLKGVKALQAADVVLYDALVDDVLLDHVPDKAVKVFVGKRASNHHYSQEQINQLVVQYALSHGHVVRLKGGDPFVFGRGHEEKAHAEAFGIPVEVVPGLSSATSLATHDGIPLTKRGVNESFWVVTATTRSGRLSNDVPLVAASSATAVILMGTRKLERITEIFRLEGKGVVPVAVIQNGTRSDQQKVTGTVNTIARKVREAGIGAPAVILIGESIGYDPELEKQALLAAYGRN